MVFLRIANNTSLLRLIHAFDPDNKYITYNGLGTDTYNGVNRWCDRTLVITQAEFEKLETVDTGFSKVNLTYKGLVIINDTLYRTFNDILYSSARDAYLSLSDTLSHVLLDHDDDRFINQTTTDLDPSILAAGISNGCLKVTSIPDFTVQQKLYERMVVLYEGKKWFMYRFPMPAITVDLVVMTTDKKVLLVTRGPQTQPEVFRNKLAIPGGFANANETLEDAAVRELKEETGIVLAEQKIKKFQFCFNADRVDRDPRQRTISAIYLALIDPSETPCNVEDTEEISCAKWYDIDQIQADSMSFDHYAILQRVVNLNQFSS